MKPVRGTTVCILVAIVAVAVLSVDTNAHFASENDIYMLRQVQALRELAPWRWDIAQPSLAIVQAKFWLANLSIYFHGPLPPAAQAIFLDIVEAATGSAGTQTYFASVGIIHVAASVLFASILLNAGCGTGASLVGSLALCLSPAWLALARGFGASWLVAVAFGQCLLVWSIQKAVTGARGASVLLSMAFTNLLLSDVLAPFGIGAAALGILSLSPEGRSNALRALRSAWMLLPGLCVVWILATNAYVFAKGASNAQQVVLFLYPFANYAVGHDGDGSAVGAARWDWSGRLRILILLFGMGLVPAILAAIFGFARAASRSGAGDARSFLRVWALVAFGGFAAIFLFYSGPTTGSQAMPLIGYPVYLLAPGIALLALGLAYAWNLSRVVAATAAALWIVGSAASAWIYVWRVDVPGPFAMLNVREATDTVGFRYPDTAVMGAGQVVRSIVGQADAGAAISVAVVADRESLPLRNILLWRAGVIDGGIFERGGRRCIGRAVVDRNGSAAEIPGDDAAAALATAVARSCTTPICVGIGSPTASRDWTIEVVGESGRIVSISGFGVGRPAGIADRVDSAGLERADRSDAFSLAGSPIGFMGWTLAVPGPISRCATGG